MKTHKYLAIVLAALILTASSCGSGDAPVSGGTEFGETESGGSDITAEAEKIAPIELCSYNGEEFHIYAPEWGGYPYYFFADEQNGEAMNDAIYTRTMRVEEQLGIDITHLIDGSIDNTLSKVTNAVMSGDDPYQLILTHCITGVGNMVTEGLLYDWNQMPHVNLDAEYWNQSCNEQLSIYGKQFYAVSDYMLLDPNCIMFNKDMVTNLKLEDPYTLVKNGTWTVDKLIEMSSAAASDINGDSRWDHDDQYGFACENNWMLASFYSAAGIRLVDKDSNDEWTLTFYGDQTLKLVSKMDYLFNKSNSAFTWKTGEDLNINMPTNRVLFQMSPIRELNLYRDCEVDFGILPYPKLDETQESYVNNDWGGLMAVPTSVGNPEMVGKACELLAFYSGDTTIPAYYDLVLGEKLARDANSKEMLELIFDNVFYDPGLYFFGWGRTQNLFHTITNIVVQQKSDSIASHYSSVETAAKAEISTFCDKVLALDN